MHYTRRIFFQVYPQEIHVVPDGFENHNAPSHMVRMNNLNVEGEFAWLANFLPRADNFSNKNAYISLF